MDQAFSLALGLGFLLGVKHATDADHIVAVTTIVSEQRSVLGSARVGTLWGLGHTAALLVAGALTLELRMTISRDVVKGLEFGVALMILALGARALYLALRSRNDLHVHIHIHDGRSHWHLHFHDLVDTHPASSLDTSVPHTHVTSGVGMKPLLVGLVHGLAGSAALTLLILTEAVRNGSGALGLAYLFVFGLGSIGGMLGVSILISLPFAVAATRFKRTSFSIRVLAGLGSIAFGIYYASRTIL